MSSELNLRPYAAGDEAAILRAHARVFAPVDSGYTPLSMEIWNWQYAKCPSGSRISLALGADGEVHGQYAGLRQSVRCDEGAVHFTQAIDSFNTRRVDAGLSRTSSFVRAGEFFAKHFCGAEPELDQVVWGLAIPAVWRIGASRLGYEHVRTVNSLVARLSELSLAAVDSHSVEESTSCPGDIDALFALVAQDRGAIAVRDRAWMDWRFAAHPSHKYLFGVVREGGVLRGVGVYRQGSFAGEEGGLICDWLVPSADECARAALLGWFRARATASGATQLVALLPDTAPEWLEFQRAGFRVLPTEYILAARSFRAPFDRNFLFWRWYYTLGDTDLV